MICFEVLICLRNFSRPRICYSSTLHRKRRKFLPHCRYFPNKTKAAPKGSSLGPKRVYGNRTLDKPIELRIEHKNTTVLPTKCPCAHQRRWEATGSQGFPSPVRQTEGKCTRGVKNKNDAELQCTLRMVFHEARLMSFSRGVQIIFPNIGVLWILGQNICHPHLQILFR